MPATLNGSNFLASPAILRVTQGVISVTYARLSKTKILYTALDISDAATRESQAGNTVLT